MNMVNDNNLLMNVFDDILVSLNKIDIFSENNVKNDNNNNNTNNNNINNNINNNNSVNSNNLNNNNLNDNNDIINNNDVNKQINNDIIIIQQEFDKLNNKINSVLSKLN